MGNFGVGAGTGPFGMARGKIKNLPQEQMTRILEPEIQDSLLDNIISLPATTEDHESAESANRQCCTALVLTEISAHMIPFGPFGSYINLNHAPPLTGWATFKGSYRIRITSECWNFNCPRYQYFQCKAAVAKENKEEHIPLEITGSYQIWWKSQTQIGGMFPKSFNGGFAKRHMNGCCDYPCPAVEKTYEKDFTVTIPFNATFTPVEGGYPFCVENQFTIGEKIMAEVLGKTKKERPAPPCCVKKVKVDVGLTTP